MADRPSAVSRGKPLARPAETRAMTVSPVTRPSAVTCAARSSACLPEGRSQVMTVDRSSRMVTAGLPEGRCLSRAIRCWKSLPLLLERANCTQGPFVWERVNQATATCVARPAMDGPLTGQPGIFQLSSCKLCGGSQAVPFQVILEISLISEGLRSRYTTSTFFPIRVISVWQQLHTRESSRISLSLIPLASKWRIRSWVLFVFSMVLPSSHIARNRPLSSGRIETKPCSHAD